MLLLSPADFFPANSFRNTIGLRPDVGPDCLQWLSADDKSRRQKEAFFYALTAYILVDSCIDIYSYSCLHPCQMNENPCSNQEIHVLFEHGSELENT